MADLPIIDSHMHLFDPEVYDISWMKKGNFPSLNKSFSLTDYEKSVENYDLVKSIYVEVNVTFSQLKDEVQQVTKLCESKDNPISAMVICADMESDDLDTYLASLLPNPFIKGVRRVMIFDDTPKGTCLKPQFIKNLQALSRYNLSFDICMRPDELLDIVPVIQQCPDVSFILDHIGNGGVKGSDLWREGIQSLAKLKNVIGCKVSGMIESSEGNWQAEDLLENFKICLEAFGEDRLLFGSNWPVCTLSGSFEDWVEALLKITMDKSDDFIHKLFYKNAEKIYKL